MRGLTPQRIEHLKRPAAWRNLATDLAWRLTPRPPEAVPLSWPLSPEDAKAIRIRWPRQYGWEHRTRLTTPILDGLRQLVPVELADVPQPIGNITVFEFTVDGVALRVAVDHEDRPLLHESVDEHPLFFKLQHQREGYGRDHVVPGGYVSTRPDLYTHFARFRELRRSSRPFYDLHGRFSLSFAPEIRRRAIDLLTAQRDFAFEGGLKVVMWSEYMREVCRARMCLDLPGRGPFTNRIVEYLAIGACILGPQHRAILHVPLVNGDHMAAAREDMEDLVALGKRYMFDEEARARMSANASDFFDRYLRREQLASYYIHECLRVARSV